MVASILRQLAAGRFPGLRRLPLARIRSVARTTLPAPLINYLEAKYYENYGELELLFVRHLCHPDRDAIDVGANTGSYTYLMQRHARLTFAFEPVADFVTSLSAKFKERVIVRDVALSDRHGTATLSIPMHDGERIAGLSSLSDKVRRSHAAHESVIVRTVPLDDAYAGTVGFIKIDVEGHEEAVLAGARRTIRACRPRVLVEIEERHAPGAIGRVRAYFRELMYDGFFVHGMELKPADAFDAGRLQRPEVIRDYGRGIDRKVFADYVNNFIFIPREEAPQLRRQLEAELARHARWLRARQGR